MTPLPPVVCLVAMKHLEHRLCCSSKDRANSSSEFFAFFLNLRAGRTDKVTGQRALQLTIAALWSSSCPCLAAAGELSLQMVSGRSQWLIWWLIGAPIKAGGMLEPLGRNTECIINSTKSRVFSVERLKQWYRGLPESGGPDLWHRPSSPLYQEGALYCIVVTRGQWGPQLNSTQLVSEHTCSQCPN